MRVEFRKKGIVIKKLIDLIEDGFLQYFTNNRLYRNWAIIFTFLLFVRFINWIYKFLF